jgi:hypothetical protein
MSNTMPLTSLGTIIINTTLATGITTAFITAKTTMNTVPLLSIIIIFSHTIAITNVPTIPNISTSNNNNKIYNSHQNVPPECHRTHREHNDRTNRNY